MDPTTVIRNLLPLALLFVLIDIPWLWFNGTASQEMFKKIQGGLPLRIRWEGVAPVYIALAYIVQQTRSTTEAFLMGLSTYAVYDFTNYSTLTNYRLDFAVADSIWGGVLFTLVRSASIWLNLL